MPNFKAFYRSMYPHRSQQKVNNLQSPAISEASTLNSPQMIEPVVGAILGASQIDTFLEKYGYLRECQ